MMMKERIEKAEKELQRVQAIADVYAILFRQYQAEYCDHRKDDDGNYMYDDNCNPIYDEKSDSPEDFNCYPWYDGERTIRSREVFREVLKLVETMK